jgi:hypothetical protein
VLAQVGGECRGAGMERAPTAAGIRGRLVTARQRLQRGQALEQRPIEWNRCAVPLIGHKLL